MAQLNFNAALVAPDPGQQDVIPAGWYNAAITASEIKPTKDGTGSYLECRFIILDGDQKDKKVYARLNIHNSNAKAVEIALAQLSAIAHAVGILQVQDSSQLHNRPLKIKVKVRPADGQYEAGNEIAAYKDINSVIAPQAEAVPTLPPAMMANMPAQPWQNAAPQQAAPQQIAPPPPGVTFPGGDVAQQALAPQQAAPQAFQHPTQGEIPPWMKQ